MTDWQQQVLFVSPFFYPELISTGKANQHLAEAFVTEGHGVTVVCSHPIYPSWVPTHSDAGIPGIKILRGGAWVRYPAAMPLRRLVLEAWFSIYTFVSVWRRRKQADVMVCILPPSLFALFLHLLLPKTVRRVAIIHDLQGVLAAQSQSLPRQTIIRLIHSVESRVFRAQDLCVFFSEDMASIAQDSYDLDSSRIAVQYPFITLPDSPTPFENVSLPQNLEEILPSDKLHVVYSGALGYKQNSQELVAMLQIGAEYHPDVQFHVFSGGPFFEQLRAQYEMLSGSRVHFHPLVAEKDLPELYARSAIQVIPQAEGTEAGALPSKLPNLLAAGVYLLGICGRESEVGRLIQQAGTGSIVEQWDHSLFLTELNEALNIVRYERASERRARVEPLLELFSVTNMVRLTLGQEIAPAAVRDAQSESNPDVNVLQSGARG